MKTLILLVILVNSSLFNVCCSQGFPIRTGGTPINYEYLTEFDSTLLNRRLIKIEMMETRSLGDGHSGTYYYYDILFTGTNKLLSSKNKTLVGEYMSVYPESKKAFKQYKAWRNGSRIGYTLFFGGMGIALYTYTNDKSELITNGILITSFSVLAISAVTTIMHKRKLNSLVNVYNKAGGFKEVKLE